MKTYYLHLSKSTIVAAIFAVALSRSVSAAVTNYIWNVASPSAASTWNTAGNWLPAAGFPGAGGDTADTVTFNNAGVSSSAASANNDVTANTTISTLNYTNIGTGNWQVTDIGAGVTLTVTNLNIGIADNGLSDVAMLDAGTLQVNSSMTVGPVQSAIAIYVVNFGGLSNFVFNASGGTMNLASAGATVANVTLAGWSNNITAGTIDFNLNDSANSETTTFTLGGGTNIINVGTLDLCYGRDTSTLSFPSGSTGGLRIRGVGGTDSSLANMEIGYHNTSGSGSHCGCTMSLNGHPVDMKFQMITLGVSDHIPTAVSPGFGAILFDTGTLYASNITMANTSAGNSDAWSTNNAITVGANGTLIVGSGGISLATVGSVTNGLAESAITNNGGTVICSNSIIINSVSGGSALGYLSLNGGTFTMVSGTIGTSTFPLTAVNLDGTLVLGVSGTNTSPLVFGSAVTASSGTIFITNVTQVAGEVSIPLISYNLSNGDPGISGLTLVLPNNYTGSLVDDGAGTISVTISPAGFSFATLLWKGAVNGTPNSSWDIGTTPDWINLSGAVSSFYTNPDYVIFDDSAKSSNIILNANVAPGAIAFSNSFMNYRISGTGSIGGVAGLVFDGTATTTLAESGGDNFSGGITINNSGQVILDDANGAISGGLIISSGATVQVGTNDNLGSLPSGAIADNGTLIFDHTTATDTVAAAISGSGTFVQNGTGTVLLSAPASYTGTTTLNAGTLALAASGTISNSFSVTVNNASIDLSGVSGTSFLQNPVLNNSAITLALPNQSITPLISSSGGITLEGTTNVVNVTVLPPIAYFPTTLELMYGAISGNFNVGLGSLPNGYHGTVSKGSDNYSVLLTITSGPVGVRPTVSWIGTDASNSGITNWSDANNWMLPGPPTPVDNVSFADVGVANNTPFNNTGEGPNGIANPQYVNNFLETSYTVGTLTYTNIVPGDYQNTFIQNGAVLNVISNGSLVVGSESTDYGSGATIYVTIGGTNGTLNVNNTNGTMYVGMGSGSAASSPANLDLSGLGTFNANVSRFLVGAGSGAEGIALGRVSGVLYLAQTSTITASIAVTGAETSDTGGNAEAIDIGDDDSNAGNSTSLYLGQTNAFYGDAIAVGRQKEAAIMEFNPYFQTNTVYFRGASTNAVGTFSIGDGVVNSGSGENASGTCDFTTASGGSDGYVNALVNTMYLGRTAAAASGSGTVSGTLNFDNGIFNVGTIFLGNNPTNAAKTAMGTINVNTNSTFGVSGTLSVSGNLIMAQTAAGGTAATSVLNIGGGTVAANNIVCDLNGGNSTITLGNNGLYGTLIVTNAIGSLAAPLTTLNLEGGVLQLSPVNGATNIVATSVSIGGPTTVNIASVATAVGGPLAIPLIRYTGSDPGIGNLIMGTAPSGFTTNNPAFTDNGSGLISLNLTAPPILTWRGAVGSMLSSNWDIGSTADWVGPSAFADYDLVQFADGASNGTVNLATALTPDSTTVTNNALTYNFIGIGNVTGGTLTKTGSGLLVVDNSSANAFSGVNIAAGTVQLGNNDANGSLGANSITDNGSLVFDQTSSSTFANVISGNGNVSQHGSGSLKLSAANTAFAGTVNVTNGTLVVGLPTALGANTNIITINNGGTLDDNGQNLSSYTNITVSGSGVNGQGAIVNNGLAQQTAFGHLTLAGNTTFGGTNRWDVRLTGGSLLTGGQPYSITKVGTNQVSLVSPGTGTNALFTIDPALSNILVEAGSFAVEQIGTNGLGNNGSVIVYSGATLELDFNETLTNTTKPIVLLDGSLLDCANGVNSLADPIVLGTNALDGAGNCTFAGSGTSMSWNNVVSGPGNLIKNGPVTLILTANNTYTGTTTINSNSLVLAGSGSLGQSAGITIAGGAIFNVSAVSFSLASGQSLGNSSGTGVINGNLATGSGILSLAYAAGVPSLVETNGTLTLSASTGVIINNTGAQLATGTYPVITTATSGFIGGTVPSSVTVTGGGAAGAASLTVSSGMLELVVASGPAPQPVITGFSISGNTLTISATNGQGNAMYSLFGTTNLNPPVVWKLVFTNSFNASGSINNFSTNLVSPGVPDEFYLLEEP